MPKNDKVKPRNKCDDTIKFDCLPDALIYSEKLDVLRCADSIHELQDTSVSVGLPSVAVSEHIKLRICPTYASDEERPQKLHRCNPIWPLSDAIRVEGPAPTAP